MMLDRRQRGIISGFLLILFPAFCIGPGILAFFGFCGFFVFCWSLAVFGDMLDGIRAFFSFDDLSK